MIIEVRLMYSWDDGGDPGILVTPLRRVFPLVFDDHVATLACDGNLKCTSGRLTFVFETWNNRWASLREEIDARPDSLLLRGWTYVSLQGECHSCKTGSEDYCKE